MSADLLTELPYKGTLACREDGAILNTWGWFHLVGAKVMRRGYGDLASRSHCLIGDVIQFIPDSDGVAS